MAGNWRLLRSQDQAFQHHAKIMDACEHDLDDGLSVSGRYYYFVTEGERGGGKENREAEEAGGLDAMVQ